MHYFGCLISISTKKCFTALFDRRPSLIMSSKWRKMLVGKVYSERLKAFVIDEAHTVKK